MVSPRLGFNWNPSGSGKDQIRGGVGVFAGRTPFVWISNDYGGTGIEITSLSASNVTFNARSQQPAEELPARDGRDLGRHASIPTSSSPRSSAAPSRTTASFPCGHPRDASSACSRRRSRTSSITTWNKVATGQHDVLRHRRSTRTPDPGFSNVTTSTNTSQGEQQNLIVQLEKRFPFGLYVQGSYAYMNAKAAFEGDVQRRVLELAVPDDGRQHLHPAAHALLLRGAASLQHRRVRRRFKTGPLLHNVGLVYFAQSGQPYSILMGGDPNGDGAFGNDLLFVPDELQRHRLEGSGSAHRSAVEHVPRDDGPRQVPRPGRRRATGSTLRGSTRWTSTTTSRFRSRWSRSSSRSTS